MKQLLLLLLATTALGPAMYAQNSKTTKKPAAPAARSTQSINWITSIDELQAKMQQEPKKVFVDAYTEWCGWCKKMDAATFTNPDLIKYMNIHFYALKLDAERKDSIIFQGKLYYFEPQYRANTFAVELMKGSMSYPTSIFMLENFQQPTPIPGYHDVREMEMFLTYFGDNTYKHVKWEDHMKNFKPRWKSGPVDAAPPAGH